MVALHTRTRAVSGHLFRFPRRLAVGPRRGSPEMDLTREKVERPRQGAPGSAPPAGLEPAPPAPEAGALSAELRGRELLKQGTIVLARGEQHPRPPGTGERW